MTADKPLIARAEARAKGCTRFRTGKACVHGHVVERLTSNKMCIECSRLASAKRRKTHREKINAYQREHRKRKQTGSTIH